MTGKGDVHFHCPFCPTPSDLPKLGVNTRDGRVFCFKCEFSASHPKWVLYHLNGGRFDLADQAAMLGSAIASGNISRDVRRALRLSGTRQGKPAKPLADEPLPDGCIPAWDHEKSLRYIASRGYRDSDRVRTIARRYCVSYCRLGRYRGYLMFPCLFPGDSRVRWWTNRYCGDAEIKSLNPTTREGHFTKSDVLLGYAQAYGRRRITFVEGPFSMFAIAYALGKKTAPVCLCGSSPLTRSQRALVRALVTAGAKEFCVGTDPDKPAFAESLASTLSDYGVPVTRIPLVGGDPDDLVDDLPKIWESRAPVGVSGSVASRLFAHTRFVAGA
jgi:hypothetical protein